MNVGVVNDDDDDGDYEKNGDDYCPFQNVSDHDCHNYCLSDHGHDRESERQIYQLNLPTNQAQILPTMKEERKKETLI